MVQQLEGVRDTQGPYFSRHFYLLEMLALIRSCILLVDLGADDIILEIFKLFFDIIR